MIRRILILSLFIFLVLGCKDENFDCEEKVVYLNESSTEVQCYCDQDIKKNYDSAVNEFSAFKLFWDMYVDAPKSEFPLDGRFSVFTRQIDDLVFYVKREKNILVWSSKAKKLNAISLENLGLIENSEQRIMNSVTENLAVDGGKKFFLQWNGTKQKEMYVVYLKKENIDNLLNELANVLF